MSTNFTRESEFSQRQGAGAQTTIAPAGYIRYAYPPEAGFALLLPYILIPYDASVKQRPTPPRTGGEFLSAPLTYLLNLSMSVANAWFAAAAADGQGDEQHFAGPEEASGEFGLIGMVATVITETPFPAGDFTYTREQLGEALAALLKKNGFGENDLPRLWYAWQIEHGITPYEQTVLQARSEVGSGSRNTFANRGRRSSNVYGTAKNGGHYDPLRN